MGMPGQCTQSMVLAAGKGQAHLVFSLQVSDGVVAEPLCGVAQPAYALGGEAWAPQAASPAADPGWMLPLTVFSQVYSTFINTAAESDMYQHQRPLPLQELWHDRAPKIGILALLKFALWHVLWTETVPSGVV